jgi:radical SAM superfamily enzyme YgiQ (UPF0313 family)
VGYINFSKDIYYNMVQFFKIKNVEITQKHKVFIFFINLDYLMLRTLLVWLPYPENDQWDFGILGKSAKKLWTVGRPLGVCYVAGAIREAGHHVEIIDAIAQNVTATSFEEFLKNENFDFIGLSGTTSAFEDIIETSKIIKKIHPKTPVAIGGAHVVSMTRINQEKHLFSPHGTIDYAIDGEGEITIVELLKSIERQKSGEKVDFSKINGMVFKENGEIIKNLPREVISDLDTIPFPALDLLKKGEYRRSPSSYKKQPDYPIMTSRGCPYNCVFCSKIFGRKVRWRSIDNVVKELKHLKNIGAKEIRFWDETFTVDKDYVINLCKKMIDEKFDLPWTCYGHVNTINEEILYWMKKAGCWEIDFGIESGNDRVLKEISKGFTTEQALRDIKLVRKMGIEARTFFMLNLPGDNKESVMDTINFALKAKPDYATFYITQVYPGTRLFDLVCSRDNLDPIEVINKMIKEKVVYYELPDLSFDELVELTKLAHRKFYRRPSYILGRLLKIRSIDDIKRYLSAGMAVFRI